MSANPTINSDIPLVNEKINFKEIDTEKRALFAETDRCQAICKVINDFIEFERETTKEEELVRSVLGHPGSAGISDLSVNLAFAIATSEKSMPIQSAIGLLSSVVLKGNREPEAVINVNQVMSELIFFASNLVTKYEPMLFEVYMTINQHMKIRNVLYVEELGEREFYPLPNEKPTKKHRPLGKYSWEPTYLDALDKLNKTMFTCLDFEEKEPAKDTEDWAKWAIRQEIRPQLTGKRFCFDWHPDYRYRMYSGGEMLATQA